LTSYVRGVVVVAAVLAAASCFGIVRARRLGRLRVGHLEQPRLSAEQLRVDALGERATLVQFSSAFCRPCVATRHLLDDVAGRVPGVRHVEVDAESNLELVRALGISSTPTTLLVNGAGVVRGRAVGVPRRHEVLAALADLDRPGTATAQVNAT
jgi:thiol-disulfide isomerase/thioredoxin